MKISEHFKELKYIDWTTDSNKCIYKKFYIDHFELRLGLFKKSMTIKWKFFIDFNRYPDGAVKQCIELENIFVRLTGKEYYELHELENIKIIIESFVNNFDKLKAFI
jgi:hypothetical protein